MAKNTNKNTNKNTSGRSVHQSIKPLEDAVASFIADIEDRLEQQRRAEKARDGRGGWYTLKDVALPLDKLKAAFLAHRGEGPEVPRAPYQRTVTRNNIRDVEMEETHESYGLAQISRVSGGARLFGSSVRHQHFFYLKVHRGRRVSTPTGEHFYTDGRVPIIEVAFSPAQFVELITTMNIGSGIPCTITEVEGIHMDPTPDDAGNELKVMVEMFEDRIGEAVDKLRAHDNDLGKLLDKKTFNKDDKEKIRSVVHAARRLLDDSAPFILKVFGEHTEKMVAKGKLEVESFITLALQRAGIKSIKDSGGKLLLGSGEGEDSDD